MRAALAACVLLAFPLTAAAGMPSPLPIDVPRTTRLSDWAAARYQTISFFLLVFFLSAAGLRLIWNFLRRDFPRLPRLSYPRAVLLVFLWGLLFVIVLTMISGGRELMTPGAWRRQGATYKLAENAPPAEAESDLALRRTRLEKLRTALWQFAATHGGRFPTSAEMNAVPSELWEVPTVGGLRYVYVGGRTAGFGPDVLAYEPEIDADRRLVLRANGDIVEMKSAELRESLTEKQP